MPGSCVPEADHCREGVRGTSARREAGQAREAKARRSTSNARRSAAQRVREQARAPRSWRRLVLHTCSTICLPSFLSSVWVNASISSPCPSSSSVSALLSQPSQPALLTNPYRRETLTSGWPLHPHTKSKNGSMPLSAAGDCGGSGDQLPGLLTEARRGDGDRLGDRHRPARPRAGRGTTRRACWGRHCC